MKLNHMLRLFVLITAILSIGPTQNFTGSTEGLVRWQQQDKEILFKEFNEKKRSDPKDAYRVAKAYLQRFGKDADDNTKYVKEWVVAYEAVMSRTGTTESNVTTPTREPDSTAASTAKIWDLNGTTWQMTGNEDGKTWAEIFVFKPGGRFQYEKYGADGSSNVRAGTWRQIDKNIFATLLGADGNTTATVRAQLKGACLQATLVLEGQPEWRFLMETDGAPNACKDEREAALKYESDPANARKLFRDLVNSVGRTTSRMTLPDTFSDTDNSLVKITEFDGCVVSLQKESDTVHFTPSVGSGKTMIPSETWTDTDSTKVTIPLSDVDLASIQLHLNNDDNRLAPLGYSLGFYTKNKVKTILTTTESHSSHGGIKTSNDSFEGWGVYLGDQEKAKRAARALTQLVKACQQN